MSNTTIPPVSELGKVTSDDVLDGYLEDSGPTASMASAIDATDTVYIEGTTMDGNFVVRIEPFEGCTSFMFGDLEYLLYGSAKIVNADHLFFSRESTHEAVIREHEEKVELGEADEPVDVDARVEERLESWREEHNISGTHVTEILRLEIGF